MSIGAPAAAHVPAGRAAVRAVLAAFSAARCLAAAATGVVAAGVVVAALRPVRRLAVVGSSMEPALAPGDRLLVVRSRRALVGQLVAFVDPRQPGRMLVKRVVRRWPGFVEVAGDNEGASTDSRHFGPVPIALVVGRPVYRYLPEVRRRRL